MVHRPFHAIACLLLTLCVLAPAMGTGVATSAGASESVPVLGSADTNLVDGLRKMDLLDTWVSTSPLAPELSIMTVTGSKRYEQDRQAFLDELHRVGSAHRETLASIALVEWLEVEHALLENHVIDLRAALLAQSRVEPIARVEATVELSDLAVLDASDPNRFDREPLGAARYQLARIRQGLRSELQAINRNSALVSKALHQSLVRVGEWHRKLREIRSLTEAERAVNAEQWSAANTERDQLIAAMEGLHEQRLIATSRVEGLPMVTLDAYVRAADDLDPDCPVDWALLAGIGRVESFHGTIDGSTVGASGLVTAAIFGPLLDGGATEREEAAAAIAAEEEAARLVAEAEAAALAEEEARAAHFNSLVWGDATTDEDDVETSDADSSDESPDADTGVNADDEDRGLSDDAADEDGDEAEEQGNGFAVIEDTDGGSLDRNDRWDRAVGPMQFIPGTWQIWSADGNNDGVSDPQNLYDAAAAAGDYLCYLARRNGNDPRTFILGYNASSSYANAVVNHADRMRQPLPQVDDDS